MSINQDLLNASACLNGYTPLIPWSASIGLKPNLIKYTERHSQPLLAEEYLLNSYYIRGDTASELSVELFYDDASIVTQSFNNQRDYSDLPQVSLPAGIALEMGLGEAILRRRSINQFTGDVVTLDYLATIARCARGVSDRGIASLKEGGEVKLDFNTVSSAGHLYPVDLYFLAMNIKGLDRGIYQYIEYKDALIQIADKKKMFEILDTFIVSSHSVMYNRCNYICLFVAHPWKSMSKYGNRGLRFILQEIGSISQNIHLANVCLGLGSTDWGGYYENEINNILGFDGINQSVLHVVLSGISN